MLGFIRERGTLTRGEVLMQFSRDDQAAVKSVLDDPVYGSAECVIRVGARVDQHNRMLSCPDDERRHVVFYVGQTVIGADELEEKWA